MNKLSGRPKRIPRKAILKALFLFLFLLTAGYLYYFTPLRSLMTPQVLGNFLEALGLWAPLVFILTYAFCICLFVPASVPTLLGAMLFGTSKGFLYGWIGAMLGASGAFHIGRALGRDLTAALVAGRLDKFDNAIEKNGFATVLYLRLLNFPFTPLNFAMSLTKVRFRDFLAGTGLGILVSFFFLTFLGGALKEVWVTGRWEELISFKVVLGAALLVFSLFIPKFIRKKPAGGKNLVEGVQTQNSYERS